MTRDDTWRSQAACKGKTDLFFPEQGYSDPSIPRKICAGCPVLKECRHWVLTGGVAITSGIVAGMNVVERRRAIKDYDAASYVTE